MSDVLSAIVATTRARVASLPAAATSTLERAASRSQPDGKRFVQVLSRADRTNVIAECKRRSPSVGLLSSAYDPPGIARVYERSGAAAISVITEPEFFGGAVDDLRRVRDVVSVPLLRKDFIVDERQLFEAAGAGADAVLLIVAILGQQELARLTGAARALGLAALVEVHDEGELDRAISSGAELLGVNARNLGTLRVGPDTLQRLAPLIPAGLVRVAESGIASRHDIDGLRKAGYQAFLVGAHLMKSPDPGAALGELLGEPVERQGRP